MRRLVFVCVYNNVCVLYIDDIKKRISNTFEGTKRLSFSFVYACANRIYIDESSFLYMYKYKAYWILPMSNLDISLSKLAVSLF